MIPLAMPLVATTQHSNGAIAVAMQQIDQIFGVGSLACTAGGDVADADRGDLASADLADSMVVKIVPQLEC